MKMDRETLEKELEELRSKLDQCFSVDTAYKNREGRTPSAGHCSVVASIIFAKYGGHMMSTVIVGESHWYNQIKLDDGTLVDVDLTADQFGYDPIRVKPEGTLYKNGKYRCCCDLTDDTIMRAKRLCGRIKKLSA